MRAPVFDAVIHAPGRLQICAMLSAADEVEFATVRDAIAVSDSVLSKHVKQLEEAGYVAAPQDDQIGGLRIEKGFALARLRQLIERSQVDRTK